MTEYTLLQRTDTDPDVWHEFLDTVKASSAKRALASVKLTEGFYVAVPTRSWRPMAVKVEQTTKVTIG